MTALHAFGLGQADIARWGRRLLAVMGAAGLLMLTVPLSANAHEAAPADQQPILSVDGDEIDPRAVENGRRWYRDRAVCSYCHGWNGRGSLVEGEPPAPSLVDTQLNRDALIETITCGRIGKTMPHHLRNAWTEEHPCYGLTQADLMEGEMPPPAIGYLRPQQIEEVADYVLAVYKGKEMTYENCTAWFQSENARQCEQYK